MLELVPKRKSYNSARECLERMKPNDSLSAISTPDLRESFIHKYLLGTYS